MDFFLSDEFWKGSGCDNQFNGFCFNIEKCLSWTLNKSPSLPEATSGVILKMLQWDEDQTEHILQEYRLQEVRAEVRPSPMNEKSKEVIKEE